MKPEDLTDTHWEVLNVAEVFELTHPFVSDEDYDEIYELIDMKALEEAGRKIRITEYGRKLLEEHRKNEPEEQETMKPFKKKDVYGYGEEIWTDDVQTTMWIETIDGVNCLVVGDESGVAMAYIPFRDMKNVINDWLTGKKEEKPVSNKPSNRELLLMNRLAQCGWDVIDGSEKIVAARSNFVHVEEDDETDDGRLVARLTDLGAAYLGGAKKLKYENDGSWTWRR